MELRETDEPADLFVFIPSSSAEFASPSKTGTKGNSARKSEYDAGLAIVALHNNNLRTVRLSLNSLGIGDTHTTERAGRRRRVSRRHLVLLVLGDDVASALPLICRLHRKHMPL